MSLGRDVDNVFNYVSGLGYWLKHFANSQMIIILYHSKSIPELLVLDLSVLSKTISNFLKINASTKFFVIKTLSNYNFI
jgi:hypothetical protein